MTTQQKHIVGGKDLGPIGSFRANSYYGSPYNEANLTSAAFINSRTHEMGFSSSRSVRLSLTSISFYSGFRTTQKLDQIERLLIPR
jgi:hypothetical protein